MKIFKMFLLFAVFVSSFREAVPAASGFTGNITYTLKTVPNPTADQSDAYAKIRSVMDSAVWYYNTYTTIKRALTVEYNTSVGTADGSSNGNIRFGKNRKYMKGCTAMHEIEHTTGIGTTKKWLTLIRFSDTVYIGTIASQKYKEIKGDSKAVLKGDSMHFWDYGLNYDYEVKSSQDLINHCLVVEAIQKDLNPSAIFADASENFKDNFSISFRLGNTFAYSLPSPCFVKAGIYTLSGQKVVEVKQGEMGPGDHSISFDSKSLPHGFYILRLEAGQHQESYSFTISR